MEENQWLFKASAAVCLIGVLACTTVNGERVPITYPTNYHYYYYNYYYYNYYYYNYQLPNCPHETFLDKHFCQECFTPHDAAREYMPEEAHYSPTPGRWTGVWKEEEEAPVPPVWIPKRKRRLSGKQNPRVD